MQLNLGGSHRVPGGQPHVQSVGRGAAGVKVGFTIRVGQSTKSGIGIRVVIVSSAGALRVVVTVGVMAGGGGAVTVIGTVDIIVVKVGTTERTTFVVIVPATVEVSVTVIVLPGIGDIIVDTAPGSDNV